MASGNIQGTVQTTRTNDYGFTSYKISGAWWGSDSKGPPRASEGEAVAFEGFDKQSKDGRTFPTIKLATFRKVAGTPTAVDESRGVSGQANGSNGQPKTSYGASGSRDTYWSDKAKSDSEKEPRIVHLAAYERAVLFVDLAIRTGCFAALEKAKPTAKLEVLQKFVDAETDRIMKSSYAATVPSLTEADTAPSDAVEAKASEVEEWK